MNKDFRAMLVDTRDLATTFGPRTRLCDVPKAAPKPITDIGPALVKPKPVPLTPKSWFSEIRDWWAT